eukprot:403333391
MKNLAEDFALNSNNKQTMKSVQKQMRKAAIRKYYQEEIECFICGGFGGVMRKYDTQRDNIGKFRVGDNDGCYYHLFCGFHVGYFQDLSSLQSFKIHPKYLQSTNSIMNNQIAQIDDDKHKQSLKICKYCNKTKGILKICEPISENNLEKSVTCNKYFHHKCAKDNNCKFVPKINRQLQDKLKHYEPEIKHLSQYLNYHKQRSYQRVSDNNYTNDPVQDIQICDINPDFDNYQNLLQSDIKNNTNTDQSKWISSDIIDVNNMNIDVNVCDNEDIDDYIYDIINDLKHQITNENSNIISNNYNKSNVPKINDDNQQQYGLMASVSINQESKKLRYYEAIKMKFQIICNDCSK